ncbi:uncharacterized protein LOC127243801 [Andrographis paniculata]|uniref:uncharacterized protein LOC127243801 n=1 Tax=Andrographis paniculata TaxID=175694 RepID=UPI0021E7DF52|nr:uncharacterized protein LOC127243801 [Andrographis paniculata]XP_051119922.1 uncharacterized protein LOC127243801 [Andrographis paniculata]
MGNCFGTQSKSAGGIAPSDMVNSRPAIKLYGQQDSSATSHIRFALLYKPVALQFVPSEAHQNPTLIYKSDVVSGSAEEILRYLDAKFPDPPLVVAGDTTASRSSIWGWCGENTPTVVWVAQLQHRSITFHLERMVRWAEDIAARGGNARGDPSMGSPRMEVKKFAKEYSQLLQVMLEHAQMEERVLFPILESADPGLCKDANEEHARHLPMMNGIKEEIKVIGVMNSGSPDYQEGLDNLSSRLFQLKENCKQHFEEEEKDLLPLMEATELNKSQQAKVLEQSLDVMRDTHSHLFRFFMDGLRPHDAVQYFGLIKKYCNGIRVSLMLHMMFD